MSAKRDPELERLLKEFVEKFSGLEVEHLELTLRRKKEDP